MQCAKTLKGRSDKKFCDSYCRTSFHNLAKRQRSSSFHHWFMRLRVNYEILSRHTTLGQNHIISWQKALDEGFYHAIYSQKHKDDSGYISYQCFNISYTITSNKEILVFSELD